MYGTIARGAVSLIGSAIGAASLEGIASAIAGSPTENEARRRVAPLFNREVAKLMAKGLSFADASTQADEEVSGHIKEEMTKSNLPDWASGILNVVGGIGGWAAGAKLAGKGLARMAASKADDAAKVASKVEAAVEDPLKKEAAKAAGSGSGTAAEVPGKVDLPVPNPTMQGGDEVIENMGPFPLRRDFSFGKSLGTQSLELPKRAPAGNAKQFDPTSGSVDPTDKLTKIYGDIDSHFGRGKVLRGPSAVMLGEADIGAEVASLPVDKRVFMVKEGMGGKAPMGDYDKGLDTPFPLGNKVRNMQKTQRQAEFDVNARIAKNRNREIFDELEKSRGALKEQQIADANAPAYNPNVYNEYSTRPNFDSGSGAKGNLTSAVSAEDLDALLFRLKR